MLTSDLWALGAGRWALGAGRWALGCLINRDHGKFLEIGKKNKNIFREENEEGCGERSLDRKRPL